MKRPIPNSVCDDCINAECVWRAPSRGIDPPVMDCPEKTTSPRTHGDRIRAMSDEELAEYFPTHASLCPDLEENKQACKGANFMANDEMCRQCWLGWLKQKGE